MHHIIKAEILSVCPPTIEFTYCLFNIKPPSTIWHIVIQKDGLIADNFDAIKTAAALLEESHLINVYFPFCLKGIYYKCSCFLNEINAEVKLRITK